MLLISLTLRQIWLFEFIWAVGGVELMKHVNRGRKLWKFGNLWYKRKIIRVLKN
jgi:hypothetical protein